MVNDHDNTVVAFFSSTHPHLENDTLSLQYKDKNNDDDKNEQQQKQ